MGKQLPHKKYTRIQLTKTFLTITQMSYGEFSKLYEILWYNKINKESLRLSVEGYAFVLKKLSLKPYKFELPTPITNKCLIQLERYFPSMYFILKNQNIVFFDEEYASMLIMIDNDLEKLLNSFEIYFKT